MESKGIIDRFNVQPVLMLTYFQAKENYKPDRSRDEPDISGFGSILRDKMNVAKPGSGKQ
jgi:hypothetical protein